MTDRARGELPVERQYRSPANLTARSALHSGYSTNRRGWFPWVFDQMDMPTECRILELGCGTGSLWQANRHCIPAGWRLVLTDTSEGMLAALRRRLDGLHQLESAAIVDAQAVPYGDSSFDAIIANHMLHHVPDLEAALSEIARVLRSGGTFYASTIGRTSMREFRQLLASCTPDGSPYLEQQAVVERFSLENGGEQLANWFQGIEVRVCEDALAVTEVEPLVAYAQSLSANSEPVLSGEGLERFRSLVSGQIRRDGAFHIGKSSGMFAARKAKAGEEGQSGADGRETCKQARVDAL